MRASFRRHVTAQRGTKTARKMRALPGSERDDWMSTHQSPHEGPRETPDVSHIKNLDITHEESDVNVRTIMGFMGGLFVSIVVCYLVVSGLYRYLETRETKLEVPPVSLVQRPSGQLPPEPRLQTDPQEDMKKLRAEEDAKLHSYGWVDPQAGIAHIPIEEAMKLIVKKGLPVEQTGLKKDEQCDCQLEAPKTERK